MLSGQFDLGDFDAAFLGSGCLLGDAAGASAIVVLGLMWRVKGPDWDYLEEGVLADSLLPRARWQADVHAALIEILEGESGVLCLDWDETCAAGDIGEALLDYLDPSGAQMRAYEQTLESGNVPSAYVESIYVLAGMAPEEALEACEGRWTGRSSMAGWWFGPR